MDATPPAPSPPVTLTLILDMETANTTTFSPLIARLAAEEGVTILSLGEVQAQFPDDWLPRFTEMDNACRAGNVGAPRTVEEMPARLEFLGVTGENCFVAVGPEGHLLGCTILDTADAAPGGTIRQGWTGVIPEWRHRGIATALKVRGIECARAHGFIRMVTTPRLTNAASIAMSHRVGFRPATEATE